MTAEQQEVLQEDEESEDVWNLCTRAMWSWFVEWQKPSGYTCETIAGTGNPWMAKTCWSEMVAAIVTTTTTNSSYSRSRNGWELAESIGPVNARSRGQVKKGVKYSNSAWFLRRTSLERKEIDDWSNAISMLHSGGERSWNLKGRWLWGDDVT